MGYLVYNFQLVIFQQNLSVHIEKQSFFGYAAGDEKGYRYCGIDVCSGNTAKRINYS